MIKLIELKEASKEKKDTYGYLSLGEIEVEFKEPLTYFCLLSGKFNLNFDKEFEVWFIQQGLSHKFSILADLTNIPEEVILFDIDNLKEEATLGILQLEESKKMEGARLGTISGDDFLVGGGNGGYFGSPWVTTNDLSSTNINPNPYLYHGINTSATSGVSWATNTIN